VARTELLDDIAYLNLAELHGFCDRHGIPYRVRTETNHGGTRSTVDTDRKPIVLDRVRHYLTTGDPGTPTVLAARIVRPEPPPARPSATDHLYYRWYSKSHPQVIKALTRLTGGRFRNGALARVLIMEFWKNGEAPTFKDFADAWVAATDGRRDLMHPAYAFLTDLRKGDAGADWKQLRTEKAKRALAVLDEFTPS
jgi:hypothetical protein